AEERDRAKEQAADDRIAAALSHLDRYGLGEYLAAGPALLERLKSGAQPVGTAIVRAAVDWQRAGLRRSVPRETLEKLHLVYLPRPTRDHGRHQTAEDLAAGMRWATERVHAAAALLIEEGDGWRAFDYLVDHYTERGDRYPVPDETWRLLQHEVTDPEERCDAGVAAYLDGQASAAEALWRPPAEAGHAAAAFNLGVLLDGQGRAADAEAWWREAAEAGHEGAANNLGVLLEERGKPAEAGVWWRRAAEAGHAA